MYFSTNPKLPFYVANQLTIDTEQQKVIMKLYQPLVGAVATSVYLTLCQQFNRVPIRSEFLRLAQLQEQLDIDLKSLFNAFHKLEAVSLLKTSTSQNDILGEALIFELKAPLAAKDFFGTFLLSSLLLEKIGEPLFKSLQQSFTPQTFPDSENARDVSAGFFEVFHMADETAINPPAVVQEVAESFAKNKQLGQEDAIAETRENELTKLIDWQFLIDQFNAYHIDEAEVNKYRKQISDMINFYQLSELEFVQLATLTLTSGDHKLNIKRIEANLTENYESLTDHASVRHSGRATTKEALVNKVSAMINNLSEADQRVLTSVNKYRPLDYLYRIKKEKGGYVTTSEKQIVYQLKQKNGLKDDLINMLIYVTLGMAPTLSKALVDRIANDWFQNGVVTAVQALSYVKNRENKRQQQGQNTKHRYYQGQGKKKEVATDWSKKKATVDPKITDEYLDKLLDKIDGK